MSLQQQGVYRFEVDWADNGFADSRCDVTSYVDITEARWGCGMLDDPRSPPFLAGAGKLPIHPREDGLFSPGETANSLTAEQLEKPHACRITGVTTGILNFDGVAVMEDLRRNQYSVGEVLTLNLHGHSFLRDGGVMSYPRGQESNLPLGTAPALDPSTGASFGTVTPTRAAWGDFVIAGTEDWASVDGVALRRGDYAELYRLISVADPFDPGLQAGARSYRLDLTGAAATAAPGVSISGSANTNGRVLAAIVAANGFDRIYVGVHGTTPVTRIFRNLDRLGTIPTGAGNPTDITGLYSAGGDHYIVDRSGAVWRITSLGTASTTASLTTIGALPSASGRTWVAAATVGSTVYALSRRTSSQLEVHQIVNPLSLTQTVLLGTISISTTATQRVSLFGLDGQLYIVTIGAPVRFWRIAIPTAPVRPTRTIRAVTEVGPLAGGVPAGSPRWLASYSGKLYMGEQRSAGVRIWELDTATGTASRPSGPNPNITLYGGDAKGLASVPGVGVGVFDDQADGGIVRIINPEHASQAAVRSDDLPAWTPSGADTDITAIGFDGTGYYLAHAAGLLRYAVVGGQNTTDTIAPTNVTGMVWDGVRLWLVDATLDKLFTYEGGVLSSITTFGPELETPRGLALHTDGNLYTVDGATMKLYRIDPGLAFADGFGIDYLDESSFGEPPLAFIDEFAATLGVERDIKRCTDPGSDISGLVRFGPAWDVKLAPVAYMSWAGGFVFATRDGRVAAAWPGDVRSGVTTISMGDYWVVEPLLVFLGEDLIVNEVQAEGYEVL